MISHETLIEAMRVASRSVEIEGEIERNERSFADAVPAHEVASSMNRLIEARWPGRLAAAGFVWPGE
jgi:hypothetical protein